MKNEKKGRFLLVLPILVLPFIAMLFWSLGGGTAGKDVAKANTGFNAMLPKGGGTQQELDKMAFYQKAQADSAKLQQDKQNDPNYRPELYAGYGSTGMNTSVYGSPGDPYAGRIQSQLQQMEWELGRSSQPFGQQRGYSPELSQLEQMMGMMNQPQAPDPEMEQLNGMLENILDLQYPERIAERQKAQSKAKRGQVFAVSTSGAEPNSTLLVASADAPNGSNEFYTLSNGRKVEQNAVQAVIAETQTLVNGSTVKMRLLNDIFINGVRIPRDNFIYGIASLQGERLEIEINSIRFERSLFPVQLAVYDLDGLNGVMIPGAITRDVAKENTDRSLQNIGIGSLDPSLGAQAASAGIEAAKSLIGKKVKLIRVVVKAGYQVLLRDEKQKEYN